MNSISNKRFAERIFGPVGTMDREPVAGMDGHLADLEVLAEPDRDLAGMEPLVFPGGDDRLHDVAGTEPFLELLPRSVSDREAVRPSSVQQRFRLPCPHALVRSGLTPVTSRCSGVLAPTHAASNQ